MWPCRFGGSKSEKVCGSIGSEMDFPLFLTKAEQVDRGRHSQDFCPHIPGVSLPLGLAKAQKNGPADSPTAR